jgi:predicted HTH domain antitoxin
MAEDTLLEIRVPVALTRLGLDENDIQRRITEWLALSLFTEGRVSSGKAARLLGMTRVGFLALLRTRGIAYINYTPEELTEEFGAVDKLKNAAK